MKRILLASVASLVMSWAGAVDAGSPLGTWKTIDDDTGKPRAVVELWQENGEIRGKILRRFTQPGDDPSGLCSKCSGDLKDKPIDGMVFVWGLKQDGDEWNGGKIVDPANGNVYSAKISLIEGGQKLKVRGFLGFSLLGRTQVWVRNM